ncbi:glycosyltransferase family 2 protein [Cohnella faecalis]|uniref:glycosyltransferase family 2 protein n=1 Tax=Cohnella faecalis TaxID=2315694 RepID=UPI003609FED5
MKRASIIIPTFNRLDLLIRCVASIRNYTDIPHEIIVVDNGSTDGTADWCRMAGVTLLSLNRNEGFPVACNRGLKISSGDTLVLLNNDTVVSPRWLSNMSLALYSAADIGIVGPITNYASGPQQVELTYPDIDSFILLADAVNRSDPHKWVPIQRIVGVCFVFRRELMEKIGLLDERFSPGHYEDDDYCLRAEQQGYRMLMCRDSLIHHEGSASFKTDPDAQNRLVERNYQIFADKWQKVPRALIR